MHHQVDELPFPFLPLSMLLCFSLPPCFTTQLAMILVHGYVEVDPHPPVPSHRRGAFPGSPTWATPPPPAPLVFSRFNLGEGPTG